MGRGKYIVLEGAQGVGKTTIVDMLVHELERLGLKVRKMHEPDSQADPTTREIRKITQDPSYPMNTRTEVLLYNAARSQSLEAVRTARDAGEIVIVDRSYLTTLAVQFYGRNDISDYKRLNDIITFAVGDMWPDMTLVLDAPVDFLQKRLKTRGETERFDNLETDMLDRIRAGYLWEAKQRNFPVIFATGRADETFQDVWRYVAQLLNLTEKVSSEPIAVADLLAKSPAAQMLKSKQQSPKNETQSMYYVPPTLPDDVQCDFCDDIERILSSGRKLTEYLAEYLEKSSPDRYTSSSAKTHSTEILNPLLPVACASDSLRQLLTGSECIDLPTSVTKSLPSGFSSTNEEVRLVSVFPRNELDLLPAMLYETLDLSINDVKATVEKWSYEVKSQLFQAYLQAYPNGKALQELRYEFEFFTDLASLASLPEDMLRTVKLQALTPRYGYDMPPEVEAAGLSDDYDAIFDLSLTLQSTLQARGYTSVSQYATLLGHKQRWLATLPAGSVRSFLTSATLLHTSALAFLAENHPLLSYVYEKKLDS